MALHNDDPLMQWQILNNFFSRQDEVTLCDVCGQSQGKGGAAFLDVDPGEKSNSYSCVCGTCYKEYTQEGKRNGKRRQQAKELKIALDMDRLIAEFDAEAPFRHNVLFFRKMDKTTTVGNCNRCTRKEKYKFLEQCEKCKKHYLCQWCKNKAHAHSCTG